VISVGTLHHIDREYPRTLDPTSKSGTRLARYLGTANIKLSRYRPMVLTEPKVVRLEDVVLMPVENAKNTWIRVLISTSEGLTYAMRVFEMDVGGHIPAHKHPWEHEIFVLEGRVRIRVEDKVFDLERYTAIYIPPNKVHEYWNVGSSRARFICVIPVRPTASEE